MIQTLLLLTVTLRPIAINVIKTRITCTIKSANIIGTHGIWATIISSGSTFVNVLNCKILMDLDAIQYLPLHETPSPLYPELQTQLNDPDSLVHVASA